MKKLYFNFIFIFIFLNFISVRICVAEESLIIGMGGTKANERIFRASTKLLQDISIKMGVKIKLISLPGERATIMLKQGDIHAEFSRIASYQDEVSAVAIKVDEPIASIPYHIYTVSHDFRVNGWESLKPYNIVTVRGLYFVKKYLKDHKTQAVESAKNAFHFLKIKRADLFIETPLIADPFLNSPDFDNSGIKRLEPPVDFLHTYTFFSLKHVDLAKKYHKALLETKKEGTYYKIQAETK